MNMCVGIYVGVYMHAMATNLPHVYYDLHLCKGQRCIRTLSMSITVTARATHMCRHL